MELVGEMHSTETDATQSEIEHYFNMRVPSEFNDKKAVKSHCKF